MKFRFATVNASKFHHGRTPAIFPIGGKRGEDREPKPLLGSSIGSEGVGGNVSPFLFASDDLRFDLSPLERCLHLRTSRFAFIRSRVNRIIGQLVKFGSARMEHRSRETYNVLRMKIIHHPPIFGEILFKPRRVIANRKDFSFLLLSFAFVRWEFKAFQDR